MVQSVKLKPCDLFFVYSVKVGWHAFICYPQLACIQIVKKEKRKTVVEIC